jgi:hypothetical protein
MNAQRPDVGAGQQFQGGNFKHRNSNLSRNEFQGTSRNKYGVTNNRYSSNRYSSRYSGRDRDRSAYTGRDRGRLAYSGRDRDRFAYAGRDRDRLAYSERFRDRDRFAYGGWGQGWNNGWGWGGPTFDVSVGYGGWGWPGYYDYGYNSGYPGLYSYAPGYVGVGFGGGCSCGAPAWSR